MKTHWDRIEDAAWLQFSIEKEQEINEEDYVDNSSAENQSVSDGEFLYFLEPKTNSFGFHAAWDSIRETFNSLNRKELKDLSDKYFSTMTTEEKNSFLNNRER